MPEGHCHTDQTAKADYILTLKDNHPTLAWLAKKVMKAAEDKTFEGTPYLRQIEKVKDHGRQETRRYTLLSCTPSVLRRAQWPGLQSIGMVEVKRTVNYETTKSVRFFVTSLTYRQMAEFMRGCVTTGILRLTSIGRSTSALPMIITAVELAMHRKISPSSNVSLSIC
ncbi:MAG: ISAs1 family transposase [Rhodospirillales bacterium]|nr:ISAs1 family transposase [Rhodospirillales bacterium]